MMNPLAPPITPVRKRPLQILSKMKRLLTAIAVLCIVASTAMAIPVQCQDPVQVQFAGITFSNPNFPYGNVNGTYTVNPLKHAPHGYCWWSFQTTPNQYGVFLYVGLTTGDNYYHITMSLYRRVGGVTTEAAVFNAQGTTIPLQNGYQYGGTTTLP